MSESESSFLPLMSNYSYNVVGPVMYEYTSWVISMAIEKKIDCLYFLARDGYLLKKIAESICKKFNLNIACKYLYCSRCSLRMPLYHLIGDEMYDLLFLKGYSLTPLSIIQRAGLDSQEIMQTFEEIGVDNPDKELTNDEFENFILKLKNESSFSKFVIKHSKDSYKAAIDYFKEQGLFENNTVAIVDSGWTGSMQRSLRQLLSSYGFNGKIIGFYFGMFAAPKTADDGEYYTFYFNKNTGLKRKIMFNNNLFECMLSANHGMTKGYSYSNGKSIPLFTESHNDSMAMLIDEQIEGSMQYTNQRLFQEDSFRFNQKEALKKCYKILKRSMVYPTAKEADMYGQFLFCDDISEAYKLSMSDNSMKNQLKNYSVIRRVFRRIFKIKSNTTPELLWIYGVIANCGPLKASWYRVNAIIWDWMRFVLIK